ncbi:MAG TPA: hypothetical protein VGS23_06905 [Thermoplasmata archaeon]|nr:hypothetical protein [Thermoplasmata archaeon]
MSWTSTLETPEIVLPALLLAGSFAAWAAWNVRDSNVAIVRATPRAVPDRDPISRAYHAFEAGRFTEVLTRAETRLDAVSERQFGRAVSRLPRTRWGARRIAPTAVAAVLGLRRLARRVGSLKDVAARREAGVWIRLDFWRSHAQLRARFRARLAPVLDEVARVTASGGGPA